MLAAMPADVLITGVSSGLGLGLARRSLDRGHAVFALGRRPPPDMAGRPGLRFAPLDLADLDAIPKALESLLTGVDRLDTVILNAGVLGPIADMVDTPMDVLKRIMDVNLWGNKVLLDSLFTGGWDIGQVVAVSSGAAVSGARGWNGYALSKAALNMLMKLYAAERPATHFSALAPGLVDTAMQEQVRRLKADDRFPVVERLRKAHGTPEMPGPDEAADRFLAVLDRLRKQKSGEFHDLRSLH